MPDNMEILKLRLLISFLKMSPESCTVTKLAKTLGEEKYSVSRGMIALGKEGAAGAQQPQTSGTDSPGERRLPENMRNAWMLR